MSQKNNFWDNGKVNTGSIIIGAIVLIIMLFALLSLARLTYRLLTFIAIPLLIATAIMDYKVLTGYVSWIVNLIKRNAIIGIVVAVLSLVAYPITVSLLFGRALLQKTLRKAVREGEKRAEQKQIGEYVDFEEIETKKPKSSSPSTDADYERFFE
ncbi:MAG: hypothetical protein HC912_08230 [Saprospiraceae bacterium]|nr:hypothetical protein [Saprospiraceae bacterium]